MGYAKFYVAHILSKARWDNLSPDEQRKEGAFRQREEPHRRLKERLRKLLERV